MQFLEQFQHSSGMLELLDPEQSKRGWESFSQLLIPLTFGTVHVRCARRLVQGSPRSPIPVCLKVAAPQLLLYGSGKERGTGGKPKAELMDDGQKMMVRRWLMVKRW